MVDVELGESVARLADEWRPLVPVYQPCDEPALRLLCLAIRRLERSSAALERAEPDEHGRLRDDEHRWFSQARRMLNDLAMVPVARGRLGLDLSRSRGELLRQHIEDRYGASELEAMADGHEEQGQEP